TVVKIAPAYDKPVVHVLDASRVVGVVGNLTNRETHNKFVSDTKREQDSAREKYLGRQTYVSFVTLEEARQRKFIVEWTSNGKPAKPTFTGTRLLSDLPLTELVPFIDWSSLFHAWEMRGTYPKILEDKVIGSCAKELFDDVQWLL